MQLIKKFIIFIIAFIIAVTVVTAIFLPKKYQALQYLDIVERYSREFFVDVYHVLATIEVESGGRVNAVSRVGAVGLMQLMPKTAVWIGEKIGITVKERDLFDKEINIMLGVAYIAYLQKSFDGDYVFCAYNAGEGMVARWLQNGGEIEYEETRKYLEKIKKIEREIKDLVYLY